MSMRGYLFDIVAGSQGALDATADIQTVHVVRPMDVVRFGAKVSVALDATPTALILALDHTPGAGGSRVEIGRFTVDVDHGVGTVVAGELADIADKLEVNPGDTLHIEVVQAAVAGDGFPFIMYEPLPFVADTSDATLSRLRHVTKYTVS